MQLVKFLGTLRNETVTLELKNGTTIVGTVTGVTHEMNCLLKNARLTKLHQDPAKVDMMVVRGNNIRYVILPDSLNLDNHLQDTQPKTTKVEPGKRKAPRS